MSEPEIQDQGPSQDPRGDQAWRDPTPGVGPSWGRPHLWVPGPRLLQGLLHCFWTFIK